MDNGGSFDALGFREESNTYAAVEAASRGLHPQCGITALHRVWNRQPVGGFTGLGTSPGRRIFSLRRFGSGTGTAAQIPGVKVAGKTGTAETGQANVYTAWFIFFAPADNPTIAGAIAVEHQLNGFGGAVSAPIAKQLMQALLPQASKP